MEEKEIDLTMVRITQEEEDFKLARQDNLSRGDKICFGCKKSLSDLPIHHRKQKSPIYLATKAGKAWAKSEKVKEYLRKWPVSKTKKQK